jgi:dTDP-4-amino-4,6-dideoxygalactose transaminase
MNFNTVTEFENQVAEFFGAPYAIAVDACTHGVELAVRYTNADYIRVFQDARTYLFLFWLIN